MSEVASHPTDYERSDVSPKLIAALAAGLGLFILAAPFGLLTLYPGVANRDAPIADSSVRTIPPPRLQTSPTQDLRSFSNAERERLGTYAWLDRERGHVRIPIQRAMALIAERGLPKWKPAQ